MFLGDISIYYIYNCRKCYLMSHVTDKCLMLNFIAFSVQLSAIRLSNTIAVESYLSRLDDCEIFYHIFGPSSTVDTSRDYLYNITRNK